MQNSYYSNQVFILIESPFIRLILTYKKERLYLAGDKLNLTVVKAVMVPETRLQSYERSCKIKYLETRKINCPANNTSLLNYGHKCDDYVITRSFSVAS